MLPEPRPGLRKTTAELAAEYGLKADEYAVILHRLGREPRPVELGVFSRDVVRALLLQVRRKNHLRQVPHHRAPG